MESRNLVVEAQMLVHRPVAECFDAFVDPEVTTRFWFTKSSGRLEPGERVRWEWETFGVGDDLTVEELEKDRRILIKWNGDETTVEWRFKAYEGGDATLVKISCWGFVGSCEEVLSQAVDAKGGYTMVLAGLKAWLEHGIELHLVRDQFPVGVFV